MLKYESVENVWGVLMWLADVIQLPDALPAILVHLVCQALHDRVVDSRIFSNQFS